MNKIRVWPQWLGWQSILLLILLLLGSRANAMTVQAEIKGGQFRWVSAQSSFGGGVAPSIWETPTGLVPADLFIPGASVLASMSMNAVGPSGSSVPLTLSLIGMEYNAPESLTHRGDDGGGSAATSFSAGLIQVSGIGIGGEQVQLSKEVSPFTHARPIFSLGDGTAIMQAFENAHATPGTYLTQVSIPVVYDYIRQGVRIRHNWSLPLSIQIEYSPAVLTDITVTSPTLGVMTPRYTTRGGVKSVQGEAVFNGTATGVFTNGLRMKLKVGDTYRMKEVAPDPADPMPRLIPYSVNCTGCDTPELVVNGVSAAGMTTTGVSIAGRNVNIITFSINVSFADVALSDLRTGSYRDQFSLLFEPDV
ncbi:hypothetical protein [Aeromonas sp. Y318-1]|uniref:hypothetical protein n=1 Tax=Aeromonas TaxID=642 RepID=UPI0022E24826|nr:hypothetical protein [Aeromonas sp. Y318-1]